ncbi:MAG: sugar phosphate isomerase/epimerase family protein [Armatimonadota bacterium]
MISLAVQMYTVREFVRDRNGFLDALQRIAAMGYAGVQLSAIGAMDTDAPEVGASAAGGVLADLGLAAVATHRPWSRLRDETDREIEFHHALGCDYAAIGGLPDDYLREGSAGFRRFIDDAAPVIHRLRSAGIRFGYHNHAHEFQRDHAAGSPPWYETLIALGGPDFHLEVDVYWAWHAGVDPVDLLARCAGRVPVIHVKDRAVGANGPEIAAIGEGNLPWGSILPACGTAGVEWLAVEQDTCPRDPFDCLASSRRYLADALA